VLGSREPGKEFVVRACGILIHHEAVLTQLAASPGGPAAALPGGHLEFGETLASCLTREFLEETGLNVEAEKLVYVHENFYFHRGLTTHELAFYFTVDLNSEFPTPDREGFVPSREEHIRLKLLPLSSLPTSTLMPAFLREQLPRDAAARFANPTRHLVTRETGR
jgi:ADP-ribose pyrophosphatase YjhB (NUDIX family)